MKETNKEAALSMAQQCSVSIPAVADALYAIGGKWKLQIIIAILEGHKRFNELQRRVEGISAKVLSNELKELEINGFLTRRVYTGIPVVVEYQVTEYSKTLQEVMRSLSDWGAMHRTRVMKGMSAPLENQN